MFFFFYLLYIFFQPLIFYNYYCKLSRGFIEFNGFFTITRWLNKIFFIFSLVCSRTIWILNYKKKQIAFPICFLLVKILILIQLFHLFLAFLILNHIALQFALLYRDLSPQGLYYLHQDLIQHLSFYCIFYKLYPQILQQSI